MKIYVDNAPENCNNCIFRQNMSQHWDLNDYCFLNKKSTNRIIMDKDCPLEELERKRYIVKLNERVAIITEENIGRLLHLYGEMDIDDLSRIVNNHLKIAIDEIEEDCLKQKEHCCAECEFMRMYDYGNRIYYCDHVDRIDDMGKLSVGELPKESPEWCPVQRSAYIVTKYAGWIKPDAVATYANINNPHNVTKEQIGLI